MTNAWPAQFRRRHACPSARSPVRWNRCGSLSKSADESRTTLGIVDRPVHHGPSLPARHVYFDHGFGTGWDAWFHFQRNKSRQVVTVNVAVKRYPFAHEIGVDAVAQRHACDGRTRLQVFLDGLGFEGLGVRVSLVRGDPLNRLESGRCAARTVTVLTAHRQQHGKSRTCLFSQAHLAVSDRWLRRRKAKKWRHLDAG
jgi:hypothetical protein